MIFRGAGPVLSGVCDSDQIGRILKSDHSGRSFQVLPFRRPTGVRQVSVLTDLRIGETATLVALDLPESVQNYLMHMGFVPDAQVTAVRRAPAGDPTVFAIDGMEIALRRETAEAIRVRTSNEAFRGKIGAESDNISAKTHQIQREIQEFAGVSR